MALDGALTMIDNGTCRPGRPALDPGAEPGAQGEALLDRAESNAPARRPRCWAGLMWRSTCASFYRWSGNFMDAKRIDNHGFVSRLRTILLVVAVLALLLVVVSPAGADPNG